MSAYLILNYSVHDADAYGEYQKGAMGALKIGLGASTDHFAVLVDGFTMPS